MEGYQPNAEKEKKGGLIIPSPCRRTRAARIHGFCFATSADPIIPKPRQTVTSTNNFLPETHFTSHESLPPLLSAFSSFIAANPQYTNTEPADDIRDREYCHLSRHICFDYTGFGLYSHAQLSHSTHPFFTISYKSVTLKSQLRYGDQGTALESAIRRRIMEFLKLSDDEYTMICTADTTSAFKLLAETYPFHCNKNLLPVYDHESEAVRSMVESAKKRGARVTSAEFCWPSMKIHSEKLEKIVRKKNKNRGLFVFPPQSQVTGRRYPYQWMSLAKAYGWHVMLDACSLGPKDMHTLGLSLIKPDFIICSFYKIFGEDPSGFAGLFIKRSSVALLEMSAADRSIGIISITPPAKPSNLAGDIHVNNLETKPSDIEVFIGPSTNPRSAQSTSSSKQKQPMSQKLYDLMKNEKEAIGESSSTGIKLQKSKTNLKIQCRYLDHADTMGLLLISRRVTCLTNWLVNALMKLKHHYTEDEKPLVRIYGPEEKLHRGPALALNLFDWKQEMIEPTLVQKLADRSNIAISCGFLRNIRFSLNYEEDEDKIFGKEIPGKTTRENRYEEKIELGITVLNVSVNFLNNFEDTYRLWSFIAKFLDADFIQRERWTYTVLNQTRIEM